MFRIGEACVFFILIAIVLCGVGADARTLDSALMVTYGQDAAKAEGDDDHTQLLEIRVPAEFSESVYLRVFDADCDGVHDQAIGDFNTETRFSLYEGPVGEEETFAGAPLVALTFSRDAKYDNEWQSLGEIEPQRGTVTGTFRVFSLVVEGLAGNDGNIFDVALSVRPERNLPVEGGQILNFGPTIRLGNSESTAELAFEIPAGVSQLEISAFDAGQAPLAFSSRTHTHKLNTSGQGASSVTTVSLDPSEAGAAGALLFGGGGGENPNDASFVISAGDGSSLPVSWPVQVAVVNNRPTLVVETRPLADCRSFVFDAEKTFDPDGDLLEFEWQMGDGSTGRGRQTVHRYDESGIYHGRVIVTDDSGWVGSAATHAFTNIVNQRPVSEAGPDRIGQPGVEMFFDGSASQDEDGLLTGFLWSFGDGATAEGQAVGHTFEEPGRYTVSLDVFDDSKGPCDSATNSLQVWVNAAPVAEAGEDLACSVGEEITLDGGRSYDSDGRVIEYFWDFGDGSTGLGASLGHAFARAGTFQITLKVTDDAGAGNSAVSDSIDVVVNVPPVAEAGPDRRAATGEVTLFDASESFDRDGLIADYFWHFGDGNTAVGSVVPYAYSEPGTYTATLTVVDNSGTSSSMAGDSLTVVVNAPPKAVAGSNQIVTTSEVLFDGTTSSDTDGTVVDYEWSFGDGVSGHGSESTHVYSEPGMYTVTLRVKDDSETILSEDHDRLTVRVNHRPTANAGGNRKTAPGLPVVFDAFDSFDPDGEIIEFSWNFGDGEMASGQSVAHVFEHPGVYEVRLQVKDDTDDTNAVDFDDVVVVVNDPPRAVAGADILTAPGQAINLDGGRSFDPDGSVTRYEWRFSDREAVESGQRLSRIFDRPGLYSAQLTVIDDSGMENDFDEDELIIRVNHQPQAEPGGGVTTCSNTILVDGSASRDPDGDPLTHQWDFGDGSTGTGTAVSHTYASAGTFPVTLTVDDGSGTANSRSMGEMMVVINLPPQAKAGEDRTVCAGDMVIFDGSASSDPEGGLLEFAWDMGDGTAVDGAYPVTSYAEGGVYPVVLRVVDDSNLECNADTDQLTVRVAEAPVAQAGADLMACADQPVLFDGSQSTDFDGVVNQFSWIFGDGGKGSGASVEHIYKEPGVFMAQLKVVGDQVGDCDNTDTDGITVTVVDSPRAVITARDRVPAGMALTLDGEGSTANGAKILGWHWETGDGATYDEAVAEHVFLDSGRYPVTLTITTDAAPLCRVVSTTKVVEVNAAPVAEAGEDQLVGIDQLVEFDASASSDSDGAIVAYRWDFGDGESAQGIRARHRYREAGRYTATLEVVDNVRLENSTVVDGLTITVNASPQPLIRVSATVVCAEQPVLFDASGSLDVDGGISDFRWDFGDGTSAVGAEISHAYDRPGLYQVTLAVDDGSGVGNSGSESSLEMTVNKEPVADAGPDRIVCLGDDVSFDGSASVDTDGSLAQFRWSFGDGAQAQGRQVSHVFESHGDFDIVLEVGDEHGLGCSSDSDTATTRVNTPPVAVAGPDRQGFVGGAHDALRFDALASSDADGDPLTFVWDFGDGTTGSGATVYHQYDRPGRFTVRLSVSDPTGLACGTTTDEVSVVISER